MIEIGYNDRRRTLKTREVRKEDRALLDADSEFELTDSSRPLTLEIDVDHYQYILDDVDVPDEQKKELIRILWNIAVNFVELGFGVHPVQLAIKSKDKRTNKKKENATERSGHEKQ